MEVLFLKEDIMKTRNLMWLLSATLLTLSFLGFQSHGATQRGGPAPVPATDKYVPNEVLVKFKAPTADICIVKSINAIQGTIITLNNRVLSAESLLEKRSDNRSFLGDQFLFRIQVQPNMGAGKAIDLLQMDPTVEFAEYNFIYHATTDYFSLQWGLNNTGSLGGVADADIDAPEAWNLFTGSSDVTIAISDTGINYDHPDLQGNIWNNPGETGGGKETDGIDNDGNGLIDDWRGWAFHDSDNDPMDNNNYDYTYHGTHVAGIVGADGSDSDGIKGVCWNSKLMAVKGLGWDGYGSSSTLINCIDYARMNGARIINASWGGGSYSYFMMQAIERALQDGVLFVVAAGNDGINIDQQPEYPACYDLDNIITVLATDISDNKPNYSNYGAYYVHLGAPGGSNSEQDEANIFSTSISTYYRYHSGTSMAAPLVSGAAALVLGQRPSLDWQQTKTIILKSVDTLSSLSGKASTGGRLNLYNALMYSTPILPDGAPTDLQATAYEDNGMYDIELTWTDNSSNETGFYIYSKSGGGFVPVGSTSTNVSTFWITAAPPGSWTFYVRAHTADGVSVKSNKVILNLD
jgi:subtilisin family serine protease